MCILYYTLGNPKAETIPLTQQPEKSVNWSLFKNVNPKFAIEEW